MPVIPASARAGRGGSFDTLQQPGFDGSTAALAWASEDPEHLWIGHRDRPNEVMAKDPAAMTPLGIAAARYPVGHVEGYPDTFRALFADVYRDVVAGRPSARPPRAR